MQYLLAFNESYAYSDDASGITIPVVLSYNDLSYNALAKVDPGSDVCLFSREIAQELGLPVEKGCR